jgi:uncharacterized membrane protein
MNNYTFFLAILFVVTLGTCPSVVTAADLSALQTALTLAHENMDKADAKQKLLAKEVALQEQLIVEKKKQLENENNRLDKLKISAKQTIKDYLESKQQYEKIQAKFDGAWEKQ